MVLAPQAGKPASYLASTGRDLSERRLTAQAPGRHARGINERGRGIWRDLVIGNARAPGNWTMRARANGFRIRLLHRQPGVWDEQFEQVAPPGPKRPERRRTLWVWLQASGRRAGGRWLALLLSRWLSRRLDDGRRGFLGLRPDHGVGVGAVACVAPPLRIALTLSDHRLGSTETVRPGWRSLPGALNPRASS